MARTIHIKFDLKKKYLIILAVPMIILFGAIIYALDDHTVTGTYSITLSDYAYNYFADRIQELGMTPDEVANYLLERELNEEYVTWITERVEGLISLIDTDIPKLELIIDQCTDIDISMYNQTEMGEDYVEQVISVINDRLDTIDIQSGALEEVEECIGRLM